MLLEAAMYKPEQLGSTHECFSDLLHAIDARELIAIACAAAGIAVKAIVAVCYRNPRIEIPGLSKPAKSFVVDLVFTVHTADDRIINIWIFEIDLSWSRVKPRRWALYLAAFENEYDADGQLVVFAPKPELRERIRTKAIPRSRVTPILIEPDHVERITDPTDARRRPHLTVLGCLFHAQPPAPWADRVAVFRAAWLAIQSLPEREAQRYHVLVMGIVSANVVEQGIEELREAGELDEQRWERFSDCDREGYTFHRGREEGLEEGQRELLRRAVLDVLELRGFEPTPEQRERISACESVEMLERWYADAKTVAANHSIDRLLS
jgi:hypothetical protein